jgi:hypothetical protein
MLLRRRRAPVTDGSELDGGDGIPETEADGIPEPESGDPAAPDVEATQDHAAPASAGAGGDEPHTADSTSPQ